MSSQWLLQAALKEIVVERGIQTGPFGSQLHASDYISSDGVPVVMPRDMISQRISTENIEYISRSMADSLARHKLIEGDIVFARRGEIGRCALITYVEQGWLCGTGSLRVRLDKTKAHPEYVVQYLATKEPITWLESNAVGQTMLNLSATVLSELPMYLPPLAEQRKIAAILGTWDAAIAKVEQLIAALQKRKQGLMQRLLTGKVRFPEFQGSEWEKVSLTEVAEIIMGQSPSSSAYNDIGHGLPLIQGNADITGRRTTPRVFTTQITKRCKVGDIILSVRAPVGETALSIHEAVIGRGVCAIRGKTVDQTYLYQLLLDNEYKWQEFAQGSTFTAINSMDIRTFNIEIPTNQKEQEKIASVLNQADVELQHMNHYRLILHQQKQALMQQLLTGQVRVRIGD